MAKVNLKMFTILSFILGTGFFFTNSAGSNDWYSNIALDKQWTITFNQEIDSNSIAENVYLVDAANQKIAINATATGKKLFVQPKSKLTYNTSYQLIVTPNLKSKTGKAMNQKITIPFTTMKKTAKQDVASPIVAHKTFISEYDLLWKMPSTDYKQFHLIGTKNQNPVGGYETRAGQTVFGIKVGSSRDAVKAKYGEPIPAITKNKKNYMQSYEDKYGHETNGTYLIDGQYVTFFYDAYKDYKVRSVTWVAAKTEMTKPGFFATPSTGLRDGFEDLMVELMNEARVAEGLDPLIYTPEYNPIARKHSTSMAENNFFNHVDLNGLRAGDRMKQAGMTYDWWGENLAYGQFSAIYAHEALMNSLGHRKNILRKEFTHVFVGVDFNSQNQPYFTINFYSL